MDKNALVDEKIAIEAEFKQVTEQKNNAEARLSELRGAYVLCNKLLDNWVEPTKEKKVK